ncbi:MAG: PD40 domain-containing protein, partial [Candidatus Coatesbacteria bacterium]|nr:PD40 domain-containing protein [Candidatus Coatesbacteria bacterium]
MKNLSIRARVAFASCLAALGLAIFAGCIASAAQEPILGAKYPSVSPDGLTICFSYMGDLWTVPVVGGEAKRLTVFEGQDSTSCWSPDGDWIAYTSGRPVSENVFVIASTGGEARQLTFNSSSDVVRSWSNDGNWILFDSNRELNAPQRQGLIYKVSPDGGEPKRVVDVKGHSGSLSPDGNSLVFARGLTRWWQKEYRGSSDDDIWLKLLDGSPAKRLTDFNGKDTDPMWSSDASEVYFLSDREGITDVWAVPKEGGDARKVSSLPADGAAFASISLDGSTIACYLDGHIYSVATATGETKRIDIYARSDVKENDIEPVTYTDNASEMALSPDGEQIAFVVRGEIFAMKRNGGKAMRLTETAARERSINWSPDGRKLLFCSDREGTMDIFVMWSTDKDEPELAKSRRRETVRLTDSDGEELNPEWSPDGKKIAYLKDRGDIWLMNPDGTGSRQLVKGPHIDSFAWSPDSRWMAYQRPFDYWSPDIAITSIDSGKTHNITRHVSSDFHPMWSDDGRRIFFISDRSGGVEEWGQTDVWQVFLTKEGHEDYLRRRMEYREDLPNDEQEDILSKKAPDNPQKVHIEFDGIDRRAIRLTDLGGGEWNFAVSHDGRDFAVSTNAGGKTEMFIFNEFGLKQREVSEISAIYTVWGPQDERLYVLDRGGSIFSAIIEDRGTRKENIVKKGIPYTAKMEIDHPAERRQMFLEAWRGLNTHFYDANMHGVDWVAVRDKYLPYLATIRTHDDFLMLLVQMAGELKASHLGAWGGGSQRRDIRDYTGDLGLIFDPEWTGAGLKVKRVIKDGPCDRPGHEVKAGEILLKVDGTEVGPNVNIAKVLTGKAREDVDLDVAKEPGGKTRKVTIKTAIIWDLYTEVYEMWVASRRALVEKFGEGRIGYLHIRGMDMGSFRKFLRELMMDVNDKEALIIDVRYNGGGYTHDRLLSVLGRSKYLYLEDRDGELREYAPHFHWEKPAVTLTNECSFSDAEIFPFSFRK